MTQDNKSADVAQETGRRLADMLRKAGVPLTMEQDYLKEAAEKKQK